MSKPIQATPTLHGKEAIDFLKKMKKNNNAKLSKTDKKLLKLMKKLPEVKR